MAGSQSRNEAMRPEICRVSSGVLGRFPGRKKGNQSVRTGHVFHPAPRLIAEIGRGGVAMSRLITGKVLSRVILGAPLSFH